MIYKFEAMSPQGVEIQDVVEADSEEKAQALIRSMGYFVIKIEKVSENYPENKTEEPFYKEYILNILGYKLTLQIEINK